MMSDRRAWMGLALAAMMPVACSGSDSNASAKPTTYVSNAEDLEMQGAWLPPRNAPVIVEPRGSRVALSQGTLLRDETLASTNEWVLLDAKQQSVRIPRNYFIKYLTASGVQEACPSIPEDFSKCVVFVGAGDTALFADVGAGATGRIVVRPLSAPPTREDTRRKRIDDLVISAATLPGADVRYEWLPERPKFGDKLDFRQERFSKGALLMDNIESSAVWSIVDAKQQKVPVQHGRFVKFLTANGVEDSQPTTADEIKGSVVLVGMGDIAVFIDVEKRAACRINVAADK